MNQTVNRRGIRYLLFFITAASLLLESVAVLFYPHLVFLPLAAGIAAGIFLTFLFRHSRWQLNGSVLLLQYGMLFSRKTVLPLNKICAAICFSSPLMRHLSLCILLLHTENHRFWLPLLSSDSAAQILHALHTASDSPR